MNRGLGGHYSIKRGGLGVLSRSGLATNTGQNIRNDWDSYKRYYRLPEFFEKKEMDGGPNIQGGRISYGLLTGSGERTGLIGNKAKKVGCSKGVVQGVIQKLGKEVGHHGASWSPID